MADATKTPLIQLQIDGTAYRVAGDIANVGSTDLTGGISIYSKVEDDFGSSSWERLQVGEEALLWPKILRRGIVGTWDRKWGDPA